MDVAGPEHRERVRAIDDRAANRDGGTKSIAPKWPATFAVIVSPTVNEPDVNVTEPVTAAP